MRDCIDRMEVWRANRAKLGCRNWQYEAQKLARYNEKIAELRKTDPRIDWSDVKILVGPRRVALWLSEVNGN